MLVEQTYVTERGRKRRRLVAVDLNAVGERLRAAGEADLAAWEQVRAYLRTTVGESTFEIWLAPLELIAVDLEDSFIVAAPAATLAWVARRFARVLDDAAQHAGRPLRLADEVERAAAVSLAPVAVVAASAAPVGLPADARVSRHVGSDRCAVDVPSARSRALPCDRSRASRAAQSADGPTDMSAYPSSYPDVYTQTKEVS